MTKSVINELSLWEKLAIDNKNRSHIDFMLGRHKSEELRRLVKRWFGTLEGEKMLKTDLREEAFGEDEILFSLSGSGKNSTIVAIDIAEETTRNAYIKQKEKGLAHKYITADVRNLPFEDNVFDMILSTSTLDHFNTEYDFIKSLLELKRVMKPTGTMIIVINNKCNFNFYLLLKLEKFLGLTSYPVQAYTLSKLRKIFNTVGLNIQNEDVIIHIISPINSLLFLLRRFIDDKAVDKIATKCISFAHWLSRRKTTKLLTGWFIALKCSKES